MSVCFECVCSLSKPEFHAEWLRDGPCDATTTGLELSSSRPVSTLTRLGDHEIRGAQLSASPNLFSFRKRGFFVALPPVLQPLGKTTDAVQIRVTLSRLRQRLGQSAAFRLRRLFCSAGSILRF